MWSIERRHFQWPWTTPTPSFKVTPFIDAEYLINGQRYGHSYYERRIRNRTQSFECTSLNLQLPFHGHDYTTSQWLPTSIILLLAVHVCCMDCALSVATACRLLLCTLCSSLLHWPRLHAAPAWWGFTNAADRNRLEAFICRAVRHGYCAHTLHLLSPGSVIKPIRHCLIA